MVFSGLYPVNNNDFETLREALGKLRLNDSSFTYQPEVSEGLGFGFRCGFLGMLHREIIQQRLERDSELDLVQTAPNVTYEILTRKGETIVIDSPQKVPDAGQIEEFREPFVRISFLLPSDEHRRPDAAVHRAPRHLRPHRVPEPDAGHPRLRDAAGGSHLRPVRQAQVGDARLRHDGLRFPRLPPGRPGAARHPGARQARRCPVDHRPPRRRPTGAAASWSRSCARRSTGTCSRWCCRRPSAAGSSPARRIAPMKKNVTAKCYGGDITRKRKLWAKQAAGKKRMKQVGQVEIPQEAFLAVLETDQ